MTAQKKADWRCPRCAALLMEFDGPFHMQWHRNEDENILTLTKLATRSSLMIKEPRGRLIVTMSDDHSPAEGREMRDQLQRDNPDLAVTVMTGVTGVVYVPGVTANQNGPLSDWMDQ